MLNKDSEIVSKILSMSNEERAIFMEGLELDTLDYLDNLLHKASLGTNTLQLKSYLKKNV